MTKKSLENKLYEKYLTLPELLQLREDMKKYDFTNLDFDYVNELIDEEYGNLVDDVIYDRKSLKSVNEYLNSIKHKFKDYNIDYSKVDYILKNIDKLKKVYNPKKSHESLLGLTFKDICYDLFSKDSSIDTNSNYESYQFEENELEDDDYYKDDID